MVDAFELRTAGQANVKTVTILGATGSVGTSTLDIIRQAPEAFQVVALTAQSNAAKLAELARAYRAKFAVIGDTSRYAELRDLLAGTGIEVAAGPEALVAAAEMPADCVVAAITGAAGLAPTFAAAGKGRRLALANKECLVAAGDVFMSAIRESGTELVPIDSEHSGAFQLLKDNNTRAVERIILTASGGPFRDWDLDRLATATPEAALKHPKWSMGPKISIDSATLMNKGLELIEAYHLFPVEARQIEVVVHPQSIIHCLVMFQDGSMLAQMSCPDMRIPISVGLAWPERLQSPVERVDLVKLQSLTFEAPDLTRFPALTLAREALERGGTAPAILNAANEVAVEGFLARRLSFLDITRTVATCLNRAEQAGMIKLPQTLEDVLEADGAGRQLARDVIGA
ncbi:MAG: 1-deoxy-D-xylulose-5-phosphate reductoisomerase [Proteobacteria bacterium]|jgi:1-deoxy-D-xylulose-5-phosphate reductoisomerase|nr:MAG: 1-deoxy-D-xylulose-5-phosphate reductoisomerase [Pseudomonadota bacterium]